MSEAIAENELQARPVVAVDHPLPLEEFRRDYLLRRRPVVIRAGNLSALDWRTDRWTPEYLVERVGAEPLDVQRRQGGVFSPTGAHVRMPFDEFVRRVMREEGDDSLYLNLQGYEHKIHPPLLQLQDDINVPEYFRNANVRWMNLWMGRTTGTAQSRLHHDYHDNLYCVVSGRKHFVLFPPKDASNLYTRGKPVRVDRNGVIHYSKEGGSRQPHFSTLNTRRVDYNRFPKFRDTEPRTADVQAGDMLFMPAGWFHEVHSSGTHIAVNFWADPPPNERILSPE